MKISRYNGILLVDKPRGVTSHDVIHRLRKVLDMRQIGHAGTLDPDATGLLVVCLGVATKATNKLSEVDKEYWVDFELGVETTTYDSTGEVVAKRDVNTSEAQLREALQTFVGEQEQLAPAYSAVKVNGKKLYEYARQNISVERPSRTIRVDVMKLHSYTQPHGSVEIACSKGTYVRALIHDLGMKLGTGAMTTAIRRTRCGKMTLERAVNLKEVLQSENPREQLAQEILPLTAPVLSQLQSWSTVSAS